MIIYYSQSLFTIWILPKGSVLLLIEKKSLITSQVLSEKSAEKLELDSFERKSFE
jgi:hypothetical protein